MKKTAGMQSDAEELKSRFELQLKTRLDQQLHLDDALSMSGPTRRVERALMSRLFKQAPAAATMAPSLQPDLVDEANQLDTSPPPPRPMANEMPVGHVEKKILKVASVRDVIGRRLEGSPAPRVDVFMEKNASFFYTEAQRNFPELLKVACNTAKARPMRKVTPNPTQGAIPTRANGAGGSA